MRRPRARRTTPHASVAERGSQAGYRRLKLFDVRVYYFGMQLLEQMTLAAMFSWWLAPLISKGVKLEPERPCPFWESISATELQ